MPRRHSRVRIGKRGVIVIPKEIREELGLREGMVLDVRVEKDAIILKTKDLWMELRERGRKLRVDLDAAERELDEADELWLNRFQQQL
ncbi:MAG: AbrB/MazE/SpoVT family DNA-binding domain-containing protein [Desulfurococcales archaeon]|nr:AbrB/MazE/SpoVT family DNA-binding domain-containing protein [Desulfurococcales archaeon]